MISLLIIGSLLSAAAAAAPPNASVAGLYEIQQMEMAGGLELQKNGHFRYALEYGAASEQGEGDWTFDGKVVRLTSRPMPKPPGFVLLRDDPAPKGQLYMVLQKPGFGWEGRFDALVTLKGGAEKLPVAAEEQGRLPLPPRAVPVAVEPRVPIYGLFGGPFPLSTERGHRLLFRFVPNDLGKAAFRGEPLMLSAGNLLMRRYDTSIRFVRVRP
jgi:hypothetical protein